MREGTTDKEHNGFGVVKKPGELSKLAQSGDAQRLVQLLQQGGGVQDAAKAAAAGDPSELIRRMQQLMNTEEGARLVERISKQARQSGLTE